MHPILFEIGGWPIYTYGALGAVGFLLIAGVGLTRTRRLGLSSDRVIDVIFWTAILGLIGSRVLYVVTNPGDFDTWQQWFQIRTGGLVFYGALVTGLPVGMLLARRYRLPVVDMLDAFATAFPLAHAVTRTGCFFAGCCYGVPTDLPWGVTFTHELAPEPLGVPVHPTQLYAVVYLLAIGAVVNWLYPRRRFRGQVILVYLMLYAVARSVNEIFRGDVERGFVLEPWLGEHLSTSQAISLAFVVGGLVVLLWRWRSRPAHAEE